MLQRIRSTVLTLVRHHDELPAFQAAYIVMTFFTAALLNIGAFGMLILLHGALDIVKYRVFQGFRWKYALRGAVREGLLDLFLLFLALAVGLYLRHAALVIAVGGVLRMFAVLTRAGGVLASKMEVFHHEWQTAAILPMHLRTARPSPVSGWSLTEHCLIVGTLACVLLTLMVPVILGVSLESFRWILARQLAPWYL